MQISLYSDGRSSLNRTREAKMFSSGTPSCVLRDVVEAGEVKAKSSSTLLVPRTEQKQLF